MDGREGFIQSLGNKRRLQLLIDIDAVVDYAIYLIDLDGKVLSSHSGAKRLKGYELEEIIGEPFTRFTLPKTASGASRQRALDPAATAGRYESEGWRLRKDGSRFWALAVIDGV